MLKFIGLRLLEAIPTLLILITVCFFMMRFTPGNPFSSERALPPKVLANLEAKYGLDKPLFVQYTTYLRNLLHGDLGPSFKYQDYSVNDLVEQALPVSLTLGGLTFLFAVVLGVGFGIVAALWHNQWVDYLLMGTAMFGIVIPNFVLGPLLILLCSIVFKWLPPGGWHHGQWQYVLLPMFSIAMHYVSAIARIQRSSLLEVLNQPYMRTARAKGLPVTYRIFRHAFRPAILPVISYLSPAFVGIITGSVIIEMIFGLPGLGQLFVNGALNRDYGMVLGLTILMGALSISFNTIVDIIYVWIEPKLSY